MDNGQRWKVLHGDCLHVLKTLPDNSIDAVVSDPPYGLSEHTDIPKMVRHWFVGKEFKNDGPGFMGKEWDSFVPGPEIWREVKRVLKPGGYLLAFSGSRTVDLMGVAIRFAGFTMTDTIMCWCYGSGFPKGLNVSKAIDKAAGAERKVVGSKAGLPGYSLAPGRGNAVYGGGIGGSGDSDRECEITAPATEQAKQWDGWNTALKPAFEPVLVAQKPFDDTIAENVQTWGTGAMNVDACRVGFQNEEDKASAFPGGKLTSHGSGSLAGPGAAQEAERGSFQATQNTKGRWPPNVLLTHHPECVEGGECHAECCTKLLDEQSGDRPSTLARFGVSGPNPSAVAKPGMFGVGGGGVVYGDSGGASRFFPQFYYHAKASRSERDAGLEDFEQRKSQKWNSGGIAAKREETAQPMANVHPTVKPIDVMRWLIKLVTPPGGVVLDPFNGSGTTGCAAMYEGCEYIGIEREAEYVAIARARIAHHASQSVAKEKPKLRGPKTEAAPDLSKLEVPQEAAPKATRTLSEADLKRLVKKSLKR